MRQLLSALAASVVMFSSPGAAKADFASFADAFNGNWRSEAAPNCDSFFFEIAVSGRGYTVSFVSARSGVSNASEAFEILSVDGNVANVRSRESDLRSTVTLVDRNTHTLAREGSGAASYFRCP